MAELGDKAPRWTGYAWAAIAAAACTAAGFAMSPRFDLVNIALVYLLGVVLVSLRFDRGPAVLAALLCVTAFDFLFVPPQGSLTVDDLQYLLAFAIMVAVALIITSLTRQAREQAEARAALALETETERIRNALLASISHDLRTPLAVMAGASSSLAERGERLSPEERGALSQSVFQQARDLSEQVTRILQMTRLENGAIEPARDWTSLQELAGPLLARLKERLAGHRLIVELPDDLPLVRVDGALIEQAIGNLLENAVRHTPAGTLIRLRAQNAGTEVVVSVEDFGPGMAEKDMQRVFSKFHHGAAEGAGGGPGLGLAICRAIVVLHGGRAWAEQIPGCGTAFRFSLPLEAQPPLPAPEPA
jgi:two-component system sensor histidine kinase KdpD